MKIYIFSLQQHDELNGLNWWIEWYRATRFAQRHLALDFKAWYLFYSYFTNQNQERIHLFWANRKSWIEWIELMNWIDSDAWKGMWIEYWFWVISNTIPTWYLFYSFTNQSLKMHFYHSQPSILSVLFSQPNSTQMVIDKEWTNGTTIITYVIFLRERASKGHRR